MKKPLSTAKAYYFSGKVEFDYSTPLRAMAQWVERNEHKLDSVLSVGIYLDPDDVAHVTLTVEWS